MKRLTRNVLAVLTLGLLTTVTVAWGAVLICADQGFFGSIHSGRVKRYGRVQGSRIGPFLRTNSLYGNLGDAASFADEIAMAVDPEAIPQHDLPDIIEGAWFGDLSYYDLLLPSDMIRPSWSRWPDLVNRMIASLDDAQLGARQYNSTCTTEQAAGFPLPALWRGWYQLSPFEAGPASPETAALQVIFVGTLRREPRPLEVRWPLTFDTMPISPIWGGLALDVVFWTSLWAIIPASWSGWKYVRAAMRMRHGACARCGYLLFGLPTTTTVCPECGAELTELPKISGDGSSSL